MTTARRVLSRWLIEAGTFEPPPKMTAAIHEFVVAHLTAILVESLEGNARYAKERLQEAEDKQNAVEAAAKALLAVMTPTATSRVLTTAYKALHELVAYYIPVQPLKATAFQKLTPETRGDLYERLHNIIERVRTEADQTTRHYKEALGRESDTADKYRRYAAGAAPLAPNGKTSQTFDVDLDGWKYGSDRLLDLAVERLHEEGQEIIDQATQHLEKMKAKGDEGSVKFLNELMQSGQELVDVTRSDVLKRLGLKSIVVTLEYVPNIMRGGQVPASWMPGMKTVIIRLPQPSLMEFEGQVKFLRRSVWHELRHVGQTILKYLLEGFHRRENVPAPGLPSRHIMTPEFKQQQKPSAPGSAPAMTLHSLDDLEFYTDLADAIELFQDALTRYEREEKRKLTREDRLKSVKRFVGLPVQVGMNETAARFKVYPFFHDLSRQAPGKYRKAVAELTKAVL